MVFALWMKLLLLERVRDMLGNRDFSRGEMDETVSFMVT